MMRRTVVTGMGIVSSLGCDLDTVSESLRRGRSGIVCDPERERLGFASALTGRLLGWNGGPTLDRKTHKSMHEPALFGTAAALSALDHSGLDRERLRSPDAGVIFGNDSTSSASAAAAARVREAGYTGALGSGAIFQMMASTVTMNLATLLGVRGANWTVAAACASSAHAVGQAAMLIGAGQQEIVISGGAQELGWESMAAFDALKTFSNRRDAPEKASRPFDRNRDGLVPSGGGAALVLESREHALSRGARIWGEVAGYAFASNGIAHLSAPTVEGPVFCMKRALSQAKLKPSDIDYVKAHATSTPTGDLLEGRAILEVFGRDGPPVSSTKSMTGHECWMSGVSELVYSMLMMRDGFIAPNINLDTLDPELAGLNVVAQTGTRGPRTVLSNSFGFGGTNASIILVAS